MPNDDNVADQGKLQQEMEVHENSKIYTHFF